MKTKKCMFIGLIGLVSLSACSKGDSGGQGSKETEKPKQPYTMMIHGGGVSAEEFDQRFRSVIEKKFPHITFEYASNGKGTNMTDLVSAGNVPDIVRTDTPTLRTGYLDLGLGYDLTELVKSFNYDTNRFNKIFMNEIYEAGGSKALYGLPVPPYFPHVLYYNKDIFDKFGVAYPKDGVTWDEVYELAKKLTRTDNGTTIRGFSFNAMSALRDNTYSLPILDPNEDKLANMDQWKSIFDNFKRFYEIPGNKHEKTVSLENTAFNKGNVAMQANQHSPYLNLPAELNWDYVAYPTMQGGLKLTPQRGPAYWAISQTSKHKDEAFEVIMEMLSDEVQLADSKRGMPATVNKTEIHDALGQDNPVFKGKNMKVIQYYPPASYSPKRKNGLVDVPLATQQRVIGDTFVDLVSNGTDVNTALRKLDEQLKTELANEKAKAK
ncbi:ABC transporter substrate-binding protein [Paenibacillus hemerocallicola]|nr:extracellular solute-binding protein [Paenibacillus hemerocallicola]